MIAQIATPITKGQVTCSTAASYCYRHSQHRHYPALLTLVHRVEAEQQKQCHSRPAAAQVLYSTAAGMLFDCYWHAMTNRYWREWSPTHPCSCIVHIQQHKCIEYINRMLRPRWACTSTDTLARSNKHSTQKSTRCTPVVIGLQQICHLGSTQTASESAKPTAATAGSRMQTRMRPVQTLGAWRRSGTLVSGQQGMKLLQRKIQEPLTPGGQACRGKRAQPCAQYWQPGGAA